MTDEERLLYLRGLSDGSVVSLGFERARAEWAALTAGMTAEERREALGVVLGVMLHERTQTGPLGALAATSEAPGSARHPASEKRPRE